MILDFLSINLLGIYLCSILIWIFYLNNNKLLYILIIDIIINGIPFVTIVMLLLYYLNRFIFKFINKNIFTKMLFINVYYILFSIIIYSIFNYFNGSIIKIIMNNYIYNNIIFYIGLKYLDDKYNIEGDSLWRKSI